MKSGEKKFIVSFRFKGNHLCIGCLVSSQHVLLAARCILDFLIHKKIPNFDYYSVLVGISSIFDNSEKEIAEVEVPRRYNFHEENCSYDVGLITVNLNITF